VNVSALTLRFDASSGGFDSAPLDAFQQTRDLLSVVEHFSLRRWGCGGRRCHRVGRGVVAWWLGWVGV
jgi:hypothetical protein